MAAATPSYTPVYVVFGAAVRPDGSPSGSLRRRTEGALSAARVDPRSLILVSGGLGRFPPPEHEVMAAILREAGFDDTRIIHDGASLDTLDTVVNSIENLHSLGRPVMPFVCTSSYHAPRCWALFRVSGMPARIVWLRGDLQGLGPLKFLYYCLRECAALPWDVCLAIVRRMRTGNADT